MALESGPHGIVFADLVAPATQDSSGDGGFPSNCPSWAEDSVYSAKRTLHALGIMSRDFSTRQGHGAVSLDQALGVLRDNAAWWHSGGSARRALTATGTTVRDIAEQLTLLVNRKINGGSTGFRGANRTRNRRAKAHD